MACSLFSLHLVFLLSVLSFTVVTKVFSQEAVTPPPETSADTSLSVSSGSVYSYTSKQIMRFPFRGLQNYLSLAPGVVQQDGFLHVRGNRKNDLGYSLDGTSVTNRFTGLEGVQVIPEAMERLELHTGVSSPLDGFANAGVVRTTMKTGGDELRIGVNYLTDDFAKPGEQFLRTSSFGFRTGVLTAEGPAPGIEALRFFLAGEHRYMRNRRPMFLTPFSFQVKTDDGYPTGPGIALPGAVAFNSNYVPNSWGESNSVQGTLTYDWAPLTFHFTGSYQKESRTLGGEWPAALVRLFNQKRTPTMETGTTFLRLRASHKVSDELSYELTVAHQRYATEMLDPDFGSEWRSFTDSLKNAAIGYKSFVSRWRGPYPYSTIFYFRINHPDAPTNTYAKNSQAAWTFAGNATYAPSENLTVRIGGDVERWTMRLFNVGNIEQAMEFLYGLRGNTPRTFASEMERRILLAQRGRINHYGFDVDGNSVDDGFDAPRKPVFASGFAQGTLRYEDLIIDLGLRVEHYDIKQRTFENFSWELFNYQLDVLDENKLINMPASTVVLPRIGLSYPVSPSTVLFGSYRETAQLPPLNLIYGGNTHLSRTLSLTTRGSVFLPPYTTSLKPERTTHVEAGLRQRLPHGMLLNATVFLKSIRDQLTYARSETDGTGYPTWRNGDEASIQGLELSLALQPRGGFSAQLQYTLSSAKGTGSNPNSSMGSVEQQIQRELLLTPLDFNQTHKATLLLDYLVPEETNPILDGLGVNLVLNYGSGHSYTGIQPLELLGAASPWNIGVVELLDPRGAYPAEPLNNSTTPWVFNVDLRIQKSFRVGGWGMTLFANVLNLLNTKHILNVYSRTGSATDDGWLTNRLASFFQAPNYEGFYRAINLDNRWAYMSATGHDLYGTPRQIRVGVNVSY